MGVMMIFSAAPSLKDARFTHANGAVCTRSGQAVVPIIRLGDEALPGAEGGVFLLDATALHAEALLHAAQRLTERFDKVAVAADGRPVLLRAPDPDGRGVRDLVKRPELLAAFVSAALQASAQTPVSLLMPFVSTADQLACVRHTMEQTMRTLTEQDLPFDELTELGAELATPAAVLCSRALASEADLLFLAVDRLAELTLACPLATPEFSSLLQAGASALLRLIEVAVGNAHLAGRRIFLGGQLCEQEGLLPHLIAMGVDGITTTSEGYGELCRRIRSCL